MSWVAAELRAPHLVVAAAPWDVFYPLEGCFKALRFMSKRRTVSLSRFPGSAAGPLPLCDRCSGLVEAEIKHQTLEAQEIRGGKVYSVLSSSHLSVQEDLRVCVCTHKLVKISALNY